MNKLLSVKNLSISFRIFNRKCLALDDVNFSIDPGECIAIVGESGSGKSTLGKAILGLNNLDTTLIETGSIYYQGTNLLSLDQPSLRAYRGKEISMIFQDPLTSLNPTMQVGNQVLESFMKHHPKITKEIAKRKVIELFNWIGISNPEERFYHYPHQFSGGMRQRVVIAIALAPNPKILIADEPTSALDPTIQIQILDLLKKIQLDLKMSIIFITHDLSIVSRFASRTIVMYAGTILEDGPTETLLQNPSHPYTQKLLKSIPRLGLNKRDRLIPIIGSPPSILHPIPGCPFHPRCDQALDICKNKRPKPNSTNTACWLYND